MIVPQGLARLLDSADFSLVFEFASCQLLGSIWKPVPRIRIDEVILESTMFVKRTETASRTNPDGWTG